MKRKNLSRKLLIAALSIAFISCTFLLLLPVGAKYGLIYAIKNNGAERVNIEDIDINIFTGNFTLSELQINTGDFPATTLHKLTVKLPISALLSKHLLIKQVSIEGLSMAVITKDKKALFIGMPIASSDKSKAPQSTEKINQESNRETSERWRLSLKELHLTENNIDIQTSAANTNLMIQQLRLSNLTNHSSEFSELFIQAQLGPSTLIQETQQTLDLSRQTLTWQSRQSANFKKGITFPEFFIKGKLSLGPLSLSTSDKKLKYTHKNLSLLISTDYTPDTQNKKPIETKVRLKTELSISDIHLNTLTTASESTDLKALNLKNKKFELQNIQHIIINNDNQPTSTTANGGLVIQGLSAKETYNEIRYSHDNLALNWSLHLKDLLNRSWQESIKSNINLTLKNATVKDLSTSPPFSSNITITSAAATLLGSKIPNSTSKFKLAGTVNNFTELLISASGTPFAQMPTADLNISTKALEIVPFSPYLNDALGYNIQQGKLSTNIHLTLRNDNLNGITEVKLNKLKLLPSSDEAVQRISKQLSMPLDLALSALRDKNNNIEISIPVHGNLSSPQFDFSDIIKTATAKATKMATMTLLKQSLQPYGTMITVAELAYKGGKKITAIKLEPITFQSGSTNLELTQKAYLKKIAELLAERPQLKLTLCGKASQIEIQRNSATKEAEDQRHNQALALAATRAKTIKAHLFNDYSIKPERLFNCQADVEKPDEENIYQGRVELHL